MPRLMTDVTRLSTAMKLLEGQRHYIDDELPPSRSYVDRHAGAPDYILHRHHTIAAKAYRCGKRRSDDTVVNYENYFYCLNATGSFCPLGSKA